MGTKPLSPFSRKCIDIYVTLCFKWWRFRERLSHSRRK